jgi:hypothetical protein
MTTEEHLRLRGIHVLETDERLSGAPELVTRFRGRAERRARSLNAQRLFPSYRYAVVREGRRWLVVAMQNRAVSE